MPRGTVSVSFSVQADALEWPERVIRAAAQRPQKLGRAPAELPGGFYAVPAALPRGANHLPVASARRRHALRPREGAPGAASEYE